jgi:hypothetical protein
MLKSRAESDPAPFTPQNRFLSVISAHTLTHIDAIMLSMNEYVSMCEAGWKVRVIFLSSIHWSNALYQYLRQKSYCYATNSSIHVTTKEFIQTPTITPLELSYQHRAIVKEELANYDVFLYHESNVVFKLSHLTAYIHESSTLHTLLSNSPLKSEVLIGFQRYCRGVGRNDINSPFGAQDVLNQERMDPLSVYTPICIQNIPYFNVTGETQQNMWILTKQQILMLQDKCQFLDLKAAPGDNR